MTSERLAELLRAEHPDAEPLEIDGETARRWVAEVGGDPDDEAALAAALVAWETLLS